MSALLREGGVMAGGALLACSWGVLRYGVGPEARTMTFSSLVIAQLLHAMTARSRHHGPFVSGSERLPPNRPLAAALAFSFALQAVAWLVPGLRRLLGLAPIGLSDTLVTLAAAAAPYLFNEVWKGHSAGAPHHDRSGASTPQEPTILLTV